MKTPCISPSTLQFLKNLEKNNHKEWFVDNKEKYEHAKLEFESFISALCGSIIQFDRSLAGIIPSKTIFRIYRDVRFSKDKSPYKINFGAHIHSGTKQSAHDRAGYYLHIQPGNSFLAGGAYQPPADWLLKIRKRLDENGEDFTKIIHHKAFKKYFTFEGETVKRPPVGFDPEHPLIDLLKHKSFLAMHRLEDADVTSSKFLEHAVNAFKALYPFDAFLNGN